MSIVYQALPPSSNNNNQIPDWLKVFNNHVEKIVKMQMSRLSKCNSLKKVISKFLYIILSFLIDVKANLIVNGNKIELAWTGLNIPSDLFGYFEHIGVNGTLIYLRSFISFNPLISYAFDAYDKLYKIDANAFSMFLNTLQEDDESIYYMSNGKRYDLLTIKDGIMTVKGLTYDMNKDVLTIDKSFFFYDFVSKLFNDKLVELLSASNVDCVVVKQDKFIIELNKVNQVVLHTRDEDIPKLLADYYKSIGIDVIPGLMNKDSLTIVNEFNKFFTTQLPKDKRDEFVRDGFVSMIMKRLGCNIFGTVEKIIITNRR